MHAALLTSLHTTGDKPMQPPREHCLALVLLSLGFVCFLVIRADLHRDDGRTRYI